MAVLFLPDACVPELLVSTSSVLVAELTNSISVATAIVLGTVVMLPWLRVVQDVAVALQRVSNPT